MTRLIDADKLEPHEQITPFGNGMYEATFVVYKDDIDEQPTVDAEPVKHGKWKKIRGAINCSVCKSSSWSMSFESLVTSFNYCPNCGAKMDVEQEKQNEIY